MTSVLGGLRGLEGNCDDGRMLLAHARSLYEEVGNQSALLTTWSSLFTDVESIAGDHAAAEAEARSSVEALQVTGGPAYASTRAVQLAELLLDRGHTDAAEPWVDLAEKDALASDVLVQFWWRTARARILARRGHVAEAEEMGRDAVAISSLTDASCHRARAHIALAEILALAARQAPARAEAAAARKLLRQKGATALLERH